MNGWTRYVDEHGDDLAIPCQNECGTQVNPMVEGGAAGLLLTNEGPILVAWCLPCFDALPPQGQGEVHDAAETEEWHYCEIDPETMLSATDGFCRYCGAHLSHVGSAGFVPYSTLEVD